MDQGDGDGRQTPPAQTHRPLLVKSRSLKSASSHSQSDYPNLRAAGIAWLSKTLMSKTYISRDSNPALARRAASPAEPQSPMPQENILRLCPLCLSRANFSIKSNDGPPSPPTSTTPHLPSSLHHHHHRSLQCPSPAAVPHLSAASNHFEPNRQPLPFQCFPPSRMHPVSSPLAQPRPEIECYTMRLIAPLS